MRTARILDRLSLSTRKATLTRWVFLVGWSVCSPVVASADVTTEAFAREVERVLPPEEPYAYHKRLSTFPVHVARRDPDSRPQAGELVIPDHGWRLVWNQRSSPVLANAVHDFQDYLAKSMSVQIDLEGLDSLDNWQGLRRSIVVGTRNQLPGCGSTLKGPKDYEIVATAERLTICGYDERGAMYGLYNLEARMNLREAPFLPADLKTVRHSLYDARMVQSWMGWMEWPDPVLAHLAHDGFDAIFASVYTNPNGDRTTAETSTDFYARLMHRIRRQDPARVRDLVNRAARLGISVYAQIIHQYTGTPESEATLRQLVRDILKQFPDIRGYVLLTEGFWYKQWGGGHGASREYIEDWARNWSKAVGIVAEECHKVNPAIEILPWEYNIDFRPQNAEVKKYFIRQLPADTIPLLTWENGKGFEIDGLRGYLRDYSISQIGPAEVTDAQIVEARQRRMKVYCHADSFLCGAQLQTVPYHPFPFQWHARYQALEKHGVNGTLESWSSGYTPSFMTELRAWYCWSDAPPLEKLLGAIADRQFGKDGRQQVLQAWDHFSQAVRLVPDTGPNMGTVAAIGNPLFFQEPPVRTATFNYSWTDQAAWTGYLGGELNPYWPFTVSRLVFYPDFANRINMAENYARTVSGIDDPGSRRVLPVFLKYLHLAADGFGEGLKLYRSAALASPASRRVTAVREVIVAEQLQRMLLSDCAILEFEDLRLQLAAEKDGRKAAAIIDRMATTLREETARTELSLLAATRDSRLGFQFECDYVYTPYSLREKLESLHDTQKQLDEHRKKLLSARD